MNNYNKYNLKFKYNYTSLGDSEEDIICSLDELAGVPTSPVGSARGVSKDFKREEQERNRRVKRRIKIPCTWFSSGSTSTAIKSTQKGEFLFLLLNLFWVLTYRRINPSNTKRDSHHMRHISHLYIHGAF